MSAPVISSATVTHGTGTHVKESVLEVLITFTDSPSNACNFTLELSLDGGSEYDTLLLHASANGQSITPGSNRLVLVSVANSFAQGGFPARAAHTGAKLRITAYDPIQELSSTPFVTSTFNFKSTLPVLTPAPSMPTYVNADQASSASLTITGHNGDGSTAPSTFRASTSASELDPGSILAFRNYTGSAQTFAFAPAVTDGQTPVYVKIYDANYNESEVVAATTWVQRTAPSHASLVIVGTRGHSFYTGISISDADGSFSVSRSATLRLAAQSPLDLEYQILTTSSVELGDEVGSWLELNAENANPVVNLTTNQSNPTVDNFNCDANVTVQVQFRDAAGNITSASSIIRLNTRIYLAHRTLLVEPDESYDHILREVTSGGAETVIPRTLTLDEAPTRAWPDIFYPTSHGYPTIADGTIDTDAAIALEGVSNSSYDAVAVQDGQLVLDGDGRPITIDWTEEKLYGHMLSSDLDSLSMWTLDNTGYEPYQLDFEYFDLSPTAYGPPFNPLAPHRGDVLVVYDATAPGCMEQTIDGLGRPVWSLADSTKLRRLYAFTGRGSNVVDLATGLRMNSSAAGGFKSSEIAGIDLVVMILYTDAAGAGSGFKLRSGTSRDTVFYNYDVDEVTGQVWVHKHSSLGSQMGAADATTKRMVYDYNDRNITIDYEAGTITFDNDPSGEITSDYTHYTGDVPETNLYLASHDDFVEYLDAPVFISASGTSELSDSDLTKIYETHGVGRMTRHGTWDKDLGLLEIDETYVPTGRRIFANYTHHTFWRLTADDHGDLTFRDPVIVADTTPSLPSYTFADILILNEGTAPAEDFKLRFVPLGYDTNNDGEVRLTGSSVVDQVLDINRPWMIQRGTKEETHTKMAAEISPNFLWDYSLTAGQAGAILSGWSNHVYGDIPARGRVFGRAVWALGGVSGSSFPSTSADQKVAGVEVTARYFSQTIL